MSTSPRAGRVRFPATRLDASHVVSAHRARNLVANNALHYADTKCSHLVNWMAPNATAAGVDTHREPDPVSDSYTRLDAWGPCRITRDKDGRPYTLRLRLMGASSNGVDVCTFAIVVLPELPSSFGLAEDATALTGIGASFKSTSATPAWLTLEDGSDLFVPSRFGRRRFRTLVDTAGADIETEVAVVYVVVFAKSANPASATPRLYGVQVSEYVGT